jgi:hypothetical protein
MKSLVATVFLALFSTGALAGPNTEVAQEVNLHPVSFLSPLTFRVKASHFDPKEFFNSFLMLEVSGTYEGNLCGGDHVVLSKTSTEQTDMRASFDVKLHSLNLWQREFEMDSVSCAMYTRPTEFTSQMRLSITNWSQQNAKTWTYRFIDENNFEQTFRIAFSIADGWTWSPTN